MADGSGYTQVSPAQGARFFGSPEQGAVVMLNLIRFRDLADYSETPELTSAEPLTGREAYAIYLEQMEPLLKQSGGELMFSGKADDFLIGPSDEKWDQVLLVRQASRASFLAFASDPESALVTAHRTAAVADSRLLPLWQDR